MLIGFTSIRASQIIRNTGKSDSAVRLALDRLTGLGLLTKHRLGHHKVVYFVNDVFETIQRPIGEALPVDLPLLSER